MKNAIVEHKVCEEVADEFVTEIPGWSKPPHRELRRRR